MQGSMHHSPSPPPPSSSSTASFCGLCSLGPSWLPASSD